MRNRFIAAPPATLPCRDTTRPCKANETAIHRAFAVGGRPSRRGFQRRSPGEVAGRDRKGAGAASAGLSLALPREGLASGTVTLPMENGRRPLVAYPQKRPLILLTPRPPQLETPFSIFDEGVLTPNDAFYVRWHLSGIPTTVSGTAHRIRVHGKVKRPLNLSVADLRTQFKRFEIIAVNECSGNS